MELDEGLPAGHGIRDAADRRPWMGVDRVVMLITGHSIRDTLPFLLAKPR